jgi:hypothetical protein
MKSGQAQSPWTAANFLPIPDAHLRLADRTVAVCHWCHQAGVTSLVPHSQPKRYMNMRCWCVPRRAIGAQPGCSQAAPHRRYRVVDQTLLEHRAIERPADERCRHRLSQCWAPLSPTKCAKNAGHFRARSRRSVSATSGLKKIPSPPNLGE